MTETEKRLDYFAAHAPEAPLLQVDAMIREDSQRSRSVRTRLQAQCDLAWEYARTMIEREKIR